MLTVISALLLILTLVAVAIVSFGCTYHVYVIKDPSQSQEKQEHHAIKEG